MPLKLTSFLVILIFLYFGNKGNCQNSATTVFSIDTFALEYKDFEGYIFILADSSKNFTLDSVITLDKNGKFIPYKINKTLLEPNQVYWAKMQLTNHLPYSEWILQVGRGNSEVQAFVWEKGQWLKKKTGRYVPLYQKSIPEPKGDDIFIRLQEDSVYTLYLRLETIDFRKPSLNPVLLSTQAYFQIAKIRGLIQGVFQGLLWIMILYNLLIFLTSKGKTYFYYSAYLFSISLYSLYFQGYLIEYFIPYHPEWEAYVWLISISLNSILYFQFTISFLESKIHFPFLHRLLLYAIIFRTLAMVILPISWHFTLDFNTINKITIYISFVEAFLIVFIYGSVLRKRNLIVLYFLAGSISLNLGAILGILFYNYSLDVFALIYQGGVVGEILLFSLGLGYKIQLTEQARRDAQDKLILQLKENEHLREAANAELEQKVIERTQEIQKQKEQIENQKDEITSSINYAQRIQDAILPKISEIQKYLPESFVLFRPRDIVSGDFYWFAATEPKALYEEVSDFHGIRRIFKGFEPEKIILAAIDCTGHGVPGSFMSVIGDGLLKQIISEHQVFEPSKILQEMDEGISKTLKRNEKNNQDGMDGVICAIDMENKRLEFAGARNPLVYIQDGKLHVIKGEKKSLGGIGLRNFAGYAQTSISLDKPITFYMFSDGYQDQFGGEHKRKFNRNQFYELLLQIHQEPMPKQHQILEQTIEKWMREGDEHQIDDIMIIGVRIAS